MPLFILWAWLIGLLGKMGGAIAGAGKAIGTAAAEGAGAAKTGLMGMMKGEGTTLATAQPQQLAVQPAAAPPQVPAYGIGMGPRSGVPPTAKPGVLDTMKGYYDRYQGIMDKMPQQRAEERPVSAPPPAAYAPQMPPNAPAWSQWLEQLRRMQVTGGGYR